MRLFVSAGLDGLAAEIERAQDRLGAPSGLRFTDPEQVHITLKFLGDTDPDRLPEITEALQTAVAESGVEPFPAEISGFGVFPDLDYISVVWVGVEKGAGKLTRLHESVETRTTALGFDPEDHEFTPHATIARMDHAGGKAQVQDVIKTQEPEVGTVHVEEIRLTESTLTPDGPEYTTVERFEL